VNGPRTREVAREAWRNLASDTTHAPVWAVILAVVVGLLGWADTTQVASLTDQSSAYLAGGGATWIIQAPGRVSGAACDALASATGAHGAGALRATSSPVTAVALPSAPLPGFEATPGIGTVLGVQVAAGILLPEPAATSLGVTTDDTLVTRAGPAPIGAVYPFPDDGRAPALGYAALILVPPGGFFDQCWITVWPSSQRTVNLLYATLSDNANAVDLTPPKLAQLNPTLASAFDAAGSFAGRFTRWAGLVCLAAGLTLGYASLIGRRLELASVLHSGWPRPALLGQITLETAAWVLAGSLIAACPTVWQANHAAADTVHLAWLGLRCVAAGAAGAIAGALAGTALIREKQLFALFKTR